jgi:signal peptidase I
MMRKSDSFWKEWIVAVMITLAIIYLIRGYVFAPYEVRGQSMYPTLNGEEFLIVNKWAYLLDKPRYGDIIIFHAKEQMMGQPRDFIKRVIGLPGDKIEIRRGHVYRNGKMLKEPYLPEPMEMRGIVDLRIPNEMIYVLGDNRNDSKDSRELGPIQLKEVVGRADVIMKPFNRMGLIGN